MKYLRMAMLVFLLAQALAVCVAMLPPETFREPIFASQDSGGDDGDSGYTEFAYARPAPC